MEDVHGIGGTPAIMKYLLDGGLFARRLFDSYWEKTLAENLKDVVAMEFEDQDVIYPTDKALKTSRKYSNTSRKSCRGRCGC